MKLTDEEIEAVFKHLGDVHHYTDSRQLIARAIEAAVLEKLTKVDVEPVKEAVNRFLCWKLPKDFMPDSFITFDGKKHDQWGGYPNSWPTGTNLFTAEQAKEMFEHCLQDTASTLAALQAENERLREDAARWRFVSTKGDDDEQYIGDRWRECMDKWDGSDGVVGFERVVDAAQRICEG